MQVFYNVFIWSWQQSKFSRDHHPSTCFVTIYIHGYIWSCTGSQVCIYWLHFYVIRFTLYVFLKALLLVCMKYTAWGESQVANIAQGEAKCYICHDTLAKKCMLSYKRSGTWKCVNKRLSFKISHVYWTKHWFLW